MLEVAIGRGARRVVLADGRLLPFREGSFERAITTHLLHLSAEWRIILSQIARVTRTEYLSVIEYPTKEPDLDEAYRTRGEAGGARVRPPGQSERRLALELRPDAEVEVATVEYETPVEELLREFAARSYVAQWEVPGPLHDRIISELRAEYRGVSQRTRLRVVLTAWAIDRIRTFAESPPAPGEGPAPAAAAP
jgi:ubiquinone/menaquinone biosynthesis C-methylase UbiE